LLKEEIEMPKYQRKPTIVEAIQVKTAGNYGVLGAIALNDWIITNADGELSTLTNTEFNNAFTLTSQNSDLIGTDVDAMPT
jgi:hypothetical protein